MTGYKGTYNGSDYSSLYPNLYRVTYRSRIGHRAYDVDKIVSANDAGHARARAQGNFAATIQGAITCEHVHTLAAA